MASQLSVLVRRHIRASRKHVFRAFTDPKKLPRWFSPSADIGTEILEHDFRVGGRYRFGFRFPDGERTTVTGVFREIASGERLVFTWSWEPPDPHAGVETLVTIVLREEQDGTEIVVTHDRFPRHEIRDRHDAGWRTTLDRLDIFLVRQE